MPLDEENIIALSLAEVWTLYKVKRKEMIKEGFTSEQEYNRIRYGITIMFELDDYIQERFRERPKSGEIVIQKIVYSIKEFRTEMEERERLMRNSLLNYYADDKDILGMRTK